MQLSVAEVNMILDWFGAYDEEEEAGAGTEAIQLEQKMRDYLAKSRFNPESEEA